MPVLSQNTVLAENRLDIRSGRWALAALSLAMLLSSLGTSIANVALPTLAQIFGASFGAVQWIVLAYLLAVTTLIVSVGRLGDIFGRRRLLLIGIAVFTLASVMCSASGSLGQIIAARALQGTGAAVMMSLAMAFVGDVVPKSGIGSAMGLLGTMSATGTALGPTLGGFLVSHVGWQAIFLVNIPLGMAALTLAWTSLPADRVKRGSPGKAFDFVGTGLLATTLGAYALAMTLGHGHLSLLSGGLMLAALVGGGLFILAETKVRDPLIDLARFKDRNFNAALVMSLIVSTVVMTTLVVGPFYLSKSLGLDAAAVGLVMSAGPVVTALTGIPAGRIVDRVGPSRLTFVGLFVMLTGASMLALLPSSLGVASYVISIMVMTAGYALFQTANNTAVMKNVAQDSRGVVSGLLNLSRNLGLVTGSAVMGAIFVAASGAPDPARSSPEAVATGMEITFAVAALLVILALCAGRLAIAGRARSR